MRALLDGLAEYAPSPRPQPSEGRTVEPGEDKVTGFVFKVQANMDPKHRDRVAFVRLCSGRFQRGMKLNMVRHSKPIAISSPIFFFAREREIAEEAWPGDIIGVPNHGQLRVGDALSEGEPLRFTGIPSFAPEILMRVRLGDPMRAKHLKAALEDLAEEGVTQVFRPQLGAEWIVGVVGQLQLDVLQTRLEAEYNLPIGFEAAPYVTARWCDADDAKELDRFRAGQARQPRHRPRRQPGLPRPQQLGPGPGAGGLPEDAVHRDPRAGMTPFQLSPVARGISARLGRVRSPSLKL